MADEENEDYTIIEHILSEFNEWKDHRAIDQHDR